MPAANIRMSGKSRLAFTMPAATTELGFDLASFTGTPILAANRGKVVFADELGIYGNSVIVDHGMGVQSLYGHFSQIDVGVGATVAVFTVVNGVLLRPLPYKDPSRIAMIWMTDSNEEGATWDLPLSSAFYADIERQSRQFDAMAAFRSWPYSLSASGGTDVERVAGARVSPALFEVLGVRPMAGQAFTKEQAVPGGPNVAMISYDLWQRRFGGAASVVGARVSLSGQSFTIIGIMPPGFTFPRGAELPAPFQFAMRTDVWTPLVFDSTEVRDYSTQNLSAVGKLSRVSSRASAQAELATILQNFLADNLPQARLGYRVISLIDQAGRTVKRGLLILLGAVLCVLLIASANVASLLVARVTNRQRELAVRAALGAGRGRIARQLVTENLVLATGGTALGVALSFWATRVMIALVPGSMPRADDISVDWRVLLFAALVAVIGGVTFGVAAAASVSWSRLTGTLHAGDTRSTGTTSQRYGRKFLVAAEVALSLMLLIGAALLTRSFIGLQRVRPGFDAHNVLTAGVGLRIAGRFDPVALGPAWATTMTAIASRLGTAPGVVAVGAVSSLPLSGASEYGGLRIVGRPEPIAGQGPTAVYSVVAGRYFAAAGISGFSTMLDVVAERSLLKRNVTPEEVGDAAVFLLSDLARGITGEVIYVDRFGTLVTNLPGGSVETGVRLVVADRDVGPLHRTFSDVEAGHLVAFVGSGGTVEVAVRNGSAARLLGAGVGASGRRAVGRHGAIRRHGAVRGHGAVAVGRHAVDRDRRALRLALRVLRDPDHERLAAPRAASRGDVGPGRVRPQDLDVG